MPSFEEMGRSLDREVARLRDLTKTKVRPATCQKAAGVLRSVSASLSRLAEQIEDKAGRKSAS